MAEKTRYSDEELQEFKEFALRGNVMDLAVGVIIGAAFQAIINSLVNDVISPLIGLFANLVPGRLPLNPSDGFAAPGFILFSFKLTK